MKLIQMKYFKVCMSFSFIHVAKYFLCESAAPSSLKGKVKNVAEGFRRVQLVGEERKRRVAEKKDGRRVGKWQAETTRGRRRREEIVNIHSTK